MLSKETKKRLKTRKVLKHSNPAQFLLRTKVQARNAIKDLIFLAENLEEKHLADIFSEKEVERLIKTVLNPRSVRTIMITEAVAFQVWQKVGRELPTDLLNLFSTEIGKTWSYAKMLSLYADKPMLKQH